MALEGRLAGPLPSRLEVLRTAAMFGRTKDTAYPPSLASSNSSMKTDGCSVPKGGSKQVFMFGARYVRRLLAIFERTHPIYKAGTVVLIPQGSAFAEYRYTAGLCQTPGV